MKRRLAVFLFSLVTLPAFALSDSYEPIFHKGDRIGVLRMPARYTQGTDGIVAGHLRRYLQEELRGAGFDGYDAQVTYDDLQRQGEKNADYYIEVVNADELSSQEGAAGIHLRDGSIDFALVIARVASAIRVYDGHTLELIQAYDLKGKCRAVVPTDIGVDLGIRGVAAWIALPFIQHAQYRAAARDVARIAVEKIRRAE